MRHVTDRCIGESILLLSTMRLFFELLIGTSFVQNARGSFPGHMVEPETHLAKRAYPLDSPVAGPWPGAKIIYCFDGDEARTHLQSVIPRAFKLWLAADLNPAFKMEEGKDDYCTAANKASYLTVMYNNQQKLSTIQGHIYSSNPEHASTTNLDPSDGFATGSGVANVAHELGHAFGFGHEHQRPSLWSADFGGNAAPGREQLLFNCENLLDYAAFQAKGANMASLCKSVQAARNVKFSALDMIADYSGKEVRTDPVDWKSIMIYGSKAGGKTVNGDRAITLTKKDGSTFDYNTVPSKTDIEAVHDYYMDELPTPEKKKSKLLWKDGNKFKGLFSKLNKGSSSSCQ